MSLIFGITFYRHIFVEYVSNHDFMLETQTFSYHFPRIYVIEMFTTKLFSNFCPNDKWNENNLFRSQKSGKELGQGNFISER